MWFLAVILVLCILYLWMIAPRLAEKPDCSVLFGWHYAHRGLHDNNSLAPENSMAAFRKAVEAGYGIELDVQLTKDRIPVVFHDETLKRVCGAEGKVRDYTYGELQKFNLCKSEEKIPKLGDFLEMVDGRVPLIIEIKIYEKASEVCQRADELIREYKGVYCIESFHPFAVKWYKEHRPEVIRGQLSANFKKSDKKEDAGMFLVHYLLTNFLCRPDFIAYDHRHKNSISRLINKYLFRALNVAWTIRSREELAAAQRDFDLFIFEKFLPEDSE